MTIADFRQYVGLQETEYTEFAELNRWTISKPVKLINESIISDISVRVEFQRKGRKVEGLYFKIEPKQQTISVGALTISRRQRQTFSFCHTFSTLLSIVLSFMTIRSCLNRRKPIQQQHECRVAFVH